LLALGALVDIIYLVVKAYNADADALKAATKAHEEAKQAVEDA